MGIIRKSFELTSEQIIFLTSLLGGEGFPGIESGKADDDAKLPSIIMAQQRLLEDKGLIQIGFDGTANINALLRDFITLGLQSTGYYCQLVENEEQILQRTYYFIGESTSYEMHVIDENNLYNIKSLYGLHDIQLQIVDRFPIVPTERKADLRMSMAEYEGWLANFRQRGGGVTAVIQFSIKDDQLHIERELSMLHSIDETWKIEVQSEDESYRLISLDFSDAMELVSAWMISG